MHKLSLFGRLPIGAKLALLLVVFGALILVGISALAYVSGRAALERAVISDLESTANEKQAAFESSLLDRLQLVTTISEFPAYRARVDSLLNGKLDAAARKTARDLSEQDLSGFVGPNANYTELMIVDARDGQVIAATNPADEGKFVEDRSYFIEGKQGPFVQNILYSLALGAPSLVVSAPIKADDGRVLAVLAAPLKLEPLNAIILRRTGAHATDDAYLVNPSNLFVTQPRFMTDPAVLQRGNFSPAVIRCLAGESGSAADLDYRGLPVLAVYDWLPDRQLCLVVQIDQAEAFAPIQSFGVTLLAIGVIGLLAGSALAVGLARTVTRPILALQQGALRFSRGDLDLRLPETSTDELGTLAHEFNAMAATLSERDARLRAYSGELELANRRQSSEIAERKHAAEKLRESEGRFSVSFNSNPIAIVLTTQAEGLAIDVNESFLRLTGFTRGAVIGKVLRAAELFPELAELAKMAQALREHGQVRNMETTLRTQSGELRTVLVSSDLVAVGAQHCVLANFLDITDRKRSEAALADRQRVLERQAQLLDLAHEAIIVRSPAGVIGFWNAGAESLYGWTRAQALAQETHTLLKTQFPVPLERIQAELNAHGRWDGELVHTTQAGQRIVVESRWALQRNSVGDDVSYLEINRDITARKQSEAKQAELLQQLEIANRELNEFAYIVSHDLKAPLRGIGSLSDWLMTDYADKLGAEGLEQLRMLNGRVKRMHALIDAILSYSRVGRVHEDRAIVDLQALAVETIDLLAPPAGISITFASELPTLLCEPTRMAQVFQNLLSNAIKFMDKPRAEIRLGCTAADGWWKFYVADNGPGIEARYFEKIFQPFQTLAARDQLESSGIGLAVVKKVVELHGGQAWVESTVGRGSTFYFTLPRSSHSSSLEAVR